MNEISSTASGGESKTHFLDYWRIVRLRLPLIGLVFVLVVGTGSIITYLMPRQIHIERNYADQGERHFAAGVWP